MTARHRTAVAMGIGAMTATVAIIAILRSVNTDGTLDGRKAMAMLISAADDLQERTVEGRLSGGFPHKPYGVTRGERRPEKREPNTRMLRAATAIHMSVTQHRTPHLTHALGVASLLVGHHDQAVDELQRALIGETQSRDLVDAVRRSTNGPLLNDLCVALHERGRVPDRRFAIEACDRAAVIWKTPESTWNYALTIDTIGLHDSAAAAWRGHLALKDAPSWRVESARRMKRSIQRAGAASLNVTFARLQAVFNAQDGEAARLVITAFPQETMQWIEEHAFTDWARARLQPNSDAAQRLRTLVVFTEEVARATGDHLLHEHAIALMRAERERPQVLPDVASAHIAYSRSREWYDASDVARALPEAERASRILDFLSLPFRHLPALTVASCAFIRRDYNRATPLTEGVIAAATARFPSTDARAQWILGLIAMDGGDPRDAVAHYTAAVKRFAVTRESGNRAAVLALLAQAQDAVGLTEASWKGRYEAFAALPQIDKPRRRHAILVEAAMAAVRDRQFSFARLLLDRAIATNVAAHDSLGIAGALRVRSMLHHLLHDERAAAADLASARRAAATLRDRASHAVFLERLDTTAALQMIRRDPARALRILENAPSAQGTLAEVAEATLGLSEAYARNPDAALRRLLAAIDAIDTRLATDDVALAQSPLVVQPLLSLYDEAIGIAIRSGRTSDALLLSERARVSVRRFNGRRAATLSDDWNLPSGSAAVVFYLSDHDVISWSVTSSGIRVAVHGGKTEELRVLAARATAELDDARADAAIRRLSDLLFAPHWSAIAGATRLLIVPDDVLWSVPFAAFRSSSRRFLAEDFIIELAGSLGDFAVCVPQPFVKLTTALLAGSSDATDGDLRPLPEVQGEIEQVARLLETAGVQTITTSTLADVESQARAVTLLHFAGHGVPNRTDPGLSYLVLGPSARLYARDIRTWRLQAHPTVVLSACEGGATRGKHLDPWGSIADAFADAGASGIIAATTAIDDREARSFALALHSRLPYDNGAHALNHVQRSAAARGAPPSSWAPYVYVAGTCH